MRQDAKELAVSGVDQLDTLFQDRLANNGCKTCVSRKCVEMRMRVEEEKAQSIPTETKTIRSLLGEIDRRN